VLKDLVLLPVYDSSEYDLVRELQVPLLQNSIEYIRGVGFFSSGWLGIASRGIVDLVENNGKTKIIMSPILGKQDWDALQLGDEAKYNDSIKEILSNKVTDLQKSLQMDTLNALAWMIADDLIEIRFAIPRVYNYPGNYHDKLGIFKDVNGDVVAIHGSLNDSIQGSLNGEAFSVFKSWEPGQLPYLQKHLTRLEALWNDQNTQFKVCNIPDSIRDKIVQLRITPDRPYSLQRSHTSHSKPTMPNIPIILHEYQKNAIEEWKKASYIGIFEMATGTGKTITSLAASVLKFKEIGNLALIILVPYLHLLEQWEKECRKFGFNPILCSSMHGRWQIDVKSSIQDLNIGVKSHICLLAVHQTAATSRFQNAIANLKKDKTMIIGDEAHWLGSKQLRIALTDKAGIRLGLSATPRRWFDDEGTNVIFSYFGSTCFEYPIEEAIGKYLVPYSYYPQFVNLNEEEIELYEELTKQIIALSSKKENNDTINDKIKILQLKRASIIASAENKLPELLKLLKLLIDENKRNNIETRDILIYCAPGKHQKVLQEVSKLGIRCHEFVHTVKLSEREKLLDQFASGDIQILVAIKCLDEGVDIPSTKTAFILASTTNPREFVQRRGRILRLSKGKSKAIIYDFFVMPDTKRMKLQNDTDINIIKREMPRFVEFASSSENEFQARSKVREILDYYQMLNLLDEKPWDVYHKLKQTDWENYE